MKKIICFVCVILLSGLAYAETETIEVGADMAVSKCAISNGGDKQLCLQEIIFPTPIQITLKKYPGSGVAPEIWIGDWKKETVEEEIFFEASVEIRKYVPLDLFPYYAIVLTIVSNAGRSSEPGNQTRVSFSINSLDELTTLNIEGDTIYTDNLSLTPHFVFGKPLGAEPIKPIPDK